MIVRRLQIFAWALGGFAAGWLAVGWVGLSNYCDPELWKSDSGCDPVKALHDWQELIAGLAAIGAAFIGGQYILQQIEFSKEQALEGTRRRHAAARAMLPITLATITQYAESCSSQLKELHRAIQAHAVPAPALDGLRIPDLPLEAIAELRNLIDTADETLQLAIADLLGEIQVLSSRLSGLSQQRDPSSHGTVVQDYLEAVIINALRVFAMSSALFAYGRRETDAISPDIPSVEEQYSAMHNLGYWDGRFDDIRATIAQRGAGQSED